VAIDVTASPTLLSDTKPDAAAADARATPGGADSAAPHEAGQWTDQCRGRRRVCLLSECMGMGRRCELGTGRLCWFVEQGGGWVGANNKKVDGNQRGRKLSEGLL
jgi:hypothetical protein